MSGRLTIDECRFGLKAGDRVQVRESGIEESFTGSVRTNDGTLLAIYRDDGKRGGGGGGSWLISATSPNNEFYLLSEKSSLFTTNMSSACVSGPVASILDFFQNIAATPEEKLLKKFGLENPIGTPTDTGLQLAARIQYTKLRAEVIEVAKKMEAEEQAATNKTV